VAFASVFDNFPVASKQSRGHLSGGGYNNPVGWIAVEWRRKVAAFDGDFGRQGHHGKTWRRQCIPNPDIDRRMQLQSPLRFQHRNLPCGHYRNQECARRAGLVNRQAYAFCETAGCAELQPDPIMGVQEQGSAITNHRRILQTISHPSAPRCPREFCPCPSSVRKWWVVLRPEEPAAPRACRAS